MALEDLNIEEIKKRLVQAWQNREKPTLDKQRETARALKDQVCNLDVSPGKAVAFVAADGGDNRIRLDLATGGGPAIVELVRVEDSRSADSKDKKSVMEVFAGGEEPTFAFEDSPFKNLCDDLGCKHLSDLSPYFDSEVRLSRTEKMKKYREILEWAVLYDMLALGNWEGDTVLVREGALRTWVFRREFFQELDAGIRRQCERLQKKKAGVYLVGVAKRTQLLTRLQFAFSLEGVLKRKDPCYLKVPRAVADEFYTRRWLDTLETADNRDYRSLAEMYLVKFGDDPLDPVWPVDVAVWQADKAEKILGYLAKDARPGFPIPDFPMCIQQAHDNAKIGGMELAYLKDLLFEGMAEEIAKDLPHGADELLRARWLKENIVDLRYRNE